MHSSVDPNIGTMHSEPEPPIISEPSKMIQKMWILKDLSWFWQWKIKNCY